MDNFLYICVAICLGGAVCYGLASNHPYRASGKASRRWPLSPPNPQCELYRACAAVLVIGAFAFGIAATFDTGRLAWIAGPSIAAIAAVLGWLVQRHTSAKIARKQHTVNILLGMRHSDVFQANRANATSEFHGGNPLSKAQLEKLRAKPDPARFEASNGRAKVPPSDSAVYILNYLEYLSVAVMLGDVDEEMVRKSLRAIVVGTLAKYWLYAKDEDNLNVAKFGDRPEKEQVPFYYLYALVCFWNAQGYLTERFEETAPEVPPLTDDCYP